MKKRSKKVSDADVASYWLEHDSTDEVDWSRPGVRLAFDPAVERPTQPVPPKAAKTPAMGPVVQKKVITAPPEPKKDEASDAEKKSDDDAI